MSYQNLEIEEETQVSEVQEGIKLKRASRWIPEYCEKCQTTVTSMYHHEKTKNHRGIPRNNQRPIKEEPKARGRELSEEEKQAILHPRGRGRPRVTDEVKRARYLIRHPNLVGRPAKGVEKADNSPYITMLNTLLSAENNYGLAPR